jgi:hypothetical protein
MEFPDNLSSVSSSIMAATIAEHKTVQSRKIGLGKLKTGSHTACPKPARDAPQFVQSKLSSTENKGGPIKSNGSHRLFAAPTQVKNEKENPCTRVTKMCVLL